MNYENSPLDALEKNNEQIQILHKSLNLEFSFHRGVLIVQAFFIAFAVAVLLFHAFPWAKEGNAERRLPEYAIGYYFAIFFLGLAAFVQAINWLYLLFNGLFYLLRSSPNPANSWLFAASLLVLALLMSMLVVGNTGVGWLGREWNYENVLFGLLMAALGTAQASTWLALFSTRRALRSLAA